MNQFELLGYSDPTGDNSPKIVAPVGRLDGKLVVLYRTMEEPSQPEIVEFCETNFYTRLGDAQKTRLSGFDHLNDTLFVWDADDVQACAANDPGYGTFLREVLADPRAQEMPASWRVHWAREADIELPAEDYAAASANFDLVGYLDPKGDYSHPKQVMPICRLLGHYLMALSHSEFGYGASQICTADAESLDPRIMVLSPENKRKLATYDSDSQSLFFWNPDDVVALPIKGPAQQRVLTAILADSRIEAMPYSERQQLSNVLGKPALGLGYSSENRL